MAYTRTINVMMDAWKPSSSKPVPKLSDQHNEKSSSSIHLTNQSISLSKSVMTMKFMRRKEITTQSQPNNNDSMSITVNNSSIKNINDKNDLVSSWVSISSNNDMSEDSSNTVNGCKILYDVNNQIDVNACRHFLGRRSFGGFNKNVERNYSEFLDDMQFDNITRKSKSLKRDINDDEMLESYANLIGLPRGPNQNRRDIETHNRYKKAKNSD